MEHKPDRPEHDDLELLPLDDQAPAPEPLPDLELLPLEPDLELLPSERQQPEPSSLEQAKTLVARADLVSEALFKEVRRWPEYNRVLATKERCAQFEKKLLRTARMIDSKLHGDTLPDDALQDLVTRLARRLAAWEHSTERQQVRQRIQAKRRRRRNRGRDTQIVRAAENGDSQRTIAARFGISRGAVEYVLLRDAPNLLKRRKASRQPPD